MVTALTLVVTLLVSDLPVPSVPGTSAVDSLSLDDHRSAQHDTIPPAGPGLFRLHGEYEITREVNSSPSLGEGLTLIIPVPLDYREQVPLTYLLAVDPPVAVRSMNTREDRPGNWVVQVVLAPFDSPGRVHLEWSSLVLVAPRSFGDVPRHASIPREWPAEARPWLASTSCVQAADPRIQQVARSLRGDGRDVPQIIQSTLTRLREIYDHQRGVGTSLDAVQALEHTGSCTSCANLAAALLRANGIPARILAGYPTWFGPLQTHYMVEAWMPGYGWYPLESTLLRAPWDPYQQVNVSIVPTDYENERSNSRPGGAPGVPYLSLTEASGDVQGYRVLGTIRREYNCDHQAELVRRFTESSPSGAWTRAIREARSRWARWIASRPAPMTKGRLSTQVSSEHFDAVDSPTGVLHALPHK
jgi:transglutaminase-like putative cysteine protease